MAPAGGQRSVSSGLDSTSDYQVAASNSTLNTWFGGRQRSWMSGAMPVKPTPRPVRQSQHQPLSEIQQTQQPQQQQQQQQRQRQTPAQTSQSRDIQVLAAQNQSSLPVQGQMSMVASAASAVLPSPAPSDEPSPALSTSLEAGSPNRNQSPAFQLPVTQAQFVLDLTVDAHNLPSASGQVPSTISPNGSSSALNNEARDIPSAVTLQTPPTPNVSTFHPVVMQNQEPPAKRRRVGNSPQETLLQKLKALGTLDERIRQCGGHQGLDSQVERPRYQLLREACTHEDTFFVILHQLFCSWSRNNREFHTKFVEGIYDTSQIDSAFGILGTILKSNAKVSPAHLEWFVHFPVLADSFRHESMDYSNMLHSVLYFLSLLAQHWMVVCHDHKSLGYPLLMDEMLSYFMLLSPILQTIMFRASRRTLGIPDGQIGMAMDELFRQDQQAHCSAHGLYNARATRDFQKEPFNAEFIRKCKALVQRMRAATSQTGQSNTRSQPNPQITPHTQPLHNNNAGVASVAPGATTFNRMPVSNVSSGQQPNANTAYTVPSTVSSNHQNYFAPPAVPPQFVFYGNEATLVNGTFPQPPPNQSPDLVQGQFNHPEAYPSGRPQMSQPAQQMYRQQVQLDAHRRRMSMQYTQAAAASYPQSHQMQTSHVIPSNGQTMVNQYSVPSNTLQQQSQAQAQYSPMHSPMPQNLAHSRRSSTNLAMPSMASTPNTASYPMAPNTNSNNQAQALAMPVMSQQQAYQIRPSNIRPQNMQYRQQQQQQQQQQQLLQHSRPFHSSEVYRIPLDQQPPSASDKRSVMISLHQCNLRSPRRIPKHDGLCLNTERYYQFIKYLALEPTPIESPHHLYTLIFDLPHEKFEKLSQDAKIHPHDSIPVNKFWNESLRLRLRCCLMPKSNKLVSESTWVTSDMTWPEHIFMQLNDHALTPRRKQHYGKHLPIELGSFACAGQNKLKISILNAKGIPERMMAFVAVEVVETLSHRAIRELPNLGPNGTIPAEETMETIKKRLTGSASQDDDDIVVVSDLSIDLTDPFSASLFTIPVRGVGCTHLQCFDLELWLMTREGKKSCICGSKTPSSCGFCPKEPSFVDKWKCPVSGCPGDARPHQLRIDGFLAQVRASLKAQNKLKTKVILVSADGTWRPKPESIDDDSDYGSDGDGTPALPSSRSSVPARQPPRRTPVDVIEIDDD